MKKRHLCVIAALGLMLGLGGCKEKEKEKENKDPYERINGEIALSEANFPDANFRSYIAMYRDDGNGSLSDEELAEIYTLSLDGMEIADLTGIEVFFNLGKLTCTYNQLTELNLSKNQKLEIVDCSKNQLTVLDVSGNKKLEALSCSNNQLTKLDVSKNPKLRSLSCNGNQLTDLDLAQNYLLEYMDCRDNAIESMDLSHCSDWGGKFFCDNSVLVEWFYQDASDGPAIDEKNFPDEAFRNYVIDEIDGDKNGILSEKEMRTTLDMSMPADVKDLTGIQYFTALEIFACTGSDLTELDLSHNRNLIFLDCSNNQLSKLDVSNNTELEKLECSANALTELDLSKNTELLHLDCVGNALTDLDVSKNTRLVTIYCSINALTKLDLSKNRLLAQLVCNGNQLTELDCSNNPGLIWLECIGNPLERLDIHNCGSDIQLMLPEDRDVNVIGS